MADFLKRWSLWLKLCINAEKFGAELLGMENGIPKVARIICAC
jgi:hypothetical protein